MSTVAKLASIASAMSCRTKGPHHVTKSIARRVVLKMTAAVPGHFSLIARRYGVEESDMLLLEYSHVLCANDLYFQYPSVEKREELLRDTFAKYMAAETWIPVM